MNVYKYVKILEPDSYYGGPDEEILFYCTDENKDKKINETLKRCLKKINQHYKLEFEKNKSYQHCEIFTNETLDVIVYLYKNKYTLFDKNKYSLSNFYYINNCHGYIKELCIADRNEKTGYRNEELQTITEFEFKSLKLKEIEYVFNERCQRVEPAVYVHLTNGNYFKFKPTELKIKDIENNYKLIKIQIN